MTSNNKQAISQKLVLPCGAVLPNRLAKSAMTEGAGDYKNRPTEGHVRLYERWSVGGAGLHITGNVMIQRGQLERSGNIVIDGEPDSKCWKGLEKWAEAGTRNGNHLWPQISHAGRQTPKTISKQPLSPSAVPLDIPGGRFAKPRVITEDEIENFVSRFANAASVFKQSGFTGVQIHAAHGYLISEFLSPKTNKRTDMWGGDLKNRARFLLKIIREMRKTVGPNFPIGVKLNSADFQKGGFEVGDSEQVAQWLAEEGIDLLEISGGSYEQPMMINRGGLETIEQSNSTQQREAYFLEYAKEIRSAVNIPVMLTGGFRTRSAMNSAVLEDNIDVIGLARPLVLQADAPLELLVGLTNEIDRTEDRLKLGNGIFGTHSPLMLLRVLNGFGTVYWYYHQFHLLAQGLEPDLKMGIAKAFFTVNARETRLAKQLWRP